MFGGVNPAQMKGMMKKMGISQIELPVKRVIFEMEGSNIVVENPSVMQIKMQGQESFQVTGDVSEEAAEMFSDEDVAMVVGQTGKSEDEVRAALEKSEGDIAEAIVGLSALNKR
jgi:nascent polypeptide-associated complex subunit alpha